MREHIAAISAALSAAAPAAKLGALPGGHPALAPDMLVNGGALTLAVNVLRRAGKDEVADELLATAVRADQGAAAPAAPAYTCCNSWFVSLPEGRQAVLRDDKWMLAHAAFDAGRAAAPQAQQPGAAYTHADVAQAHADGYKLGMSQVDRAGAQAVPPEELRKLLADARHRIANLSRAVVPFDDPQDGPILRRLDAALEASPTCASGSQAVPSEAKAVPLREAVRKITDLASTYASICANNPERVNQSWLNLVRLVEEIVAAAAAPAAVSVPSGIDALLEAIRKLPAVRAAEIDGEESDGTPKHWRSRPYISLTQLERLLRAELVAVPATAAPAAVSAPSVPEGWKLVPRAPAQEGGACVGWPAGPTDSEQDGNAMLQALAPQMLAACEYMLKNAFERKWEGDERAYSMLSSIIRQAPKLAAKEPANDR